MKENEHVRIPVLPDKASGYVLWTKESSKKWIELPGYLIYPL